MDDTAAVNHTPSPHQLHTPVALRPGDLEQMTHSNQGEVTAFSEMTSQKTPSRKFFRFNVLPPESLKTLKEG
jgi:hypothetical protein